MKKYLFVFIALLAVLISCSDIQPKGKAYIISVGIEYPSSDGPLFPDGFHYLKECPVLDSTAVTNCFSDIYEKSNIPCETYHTVFYKDCLQTGTTTPSDVGILSMIESLDVCPEDMIVFYFSGHGKREREDSVYCSYLVTASKQSLKTEDLIAALNSKGCNCLIMLDCCFNGAFHEGTDVEYSNLFEDRNDLHIALLAASKQSESSYCYEKEISCFTRSILDALYYDSSTGKVSEVHKGLSAGTLFEDACACFSERYKGVSRIINGQHPQMSAGNLDIMVIPR